MSKLLMKSLKADLPALAELIRSQGRGRDTVLAHITPKEAALLKKRGGSGTINPDTGLPEFEDYGGDYGGGDYGGSYGGDVEAQPGGYYGGEAPTPQQFAEVYPDYTAPTISARPNIPVPSYDVEAQPGGFYGGAAPTAAEFGRGLPEGRDQYELAAGGITPPQLTTPEKPWYEKLGLSTKDLTRLGLGAALTGGLAATNVARTRQAAQQNQAARAEMAAIGKPYQEAGAQLTGAAQRGELSAASQQALQAAQAQMAQGVATRGGVGAAQAQTQLAALRNLMLENQYNFGLKVSQIGDSYALGAIKTGMEADRYLNQANQQFYGTLAQMLAPFITGAPAATPTK
jgi:hypothetical protein